MVVFDTNRGTILEEARFGPEDRTTKKLELFQILESLEVHSSSSAISREG